MGVGGRVLFSKVLTLSNSSSITEQATKGREKLLKIVRVNIRNFLPQFYPNSLKVHREHYMTAHGYNFLSTSVDTIFHE